MNVAGGRVVRFACILLNCNTMKDIKDMIFNSLQQNKENMHVASELGIVPDAEMSGSYK